MAYKVKVDVVRGRRLRAEILENNHSQQKFINYLKVGPLLFQQNLRLLIVITRLSIEVFFLLPAEFRY